MTALPPHPNLDKTGSEPATRTGRSTLHEELLFRISAFQVCVSLLANIDLTPRVPGTPACAYIVESRAPA